ncbi:MAG: 16S rRNA processing protein RimM [Syntrophobacterales bacterium CG_4_8_14_3_um_filter_58_8]|nr:MAG: 16S rRNA processing protein RimM [Syntrophobacterales bacterium CG03_land_8_20_14_0_80_58_14]PJC76047.1 MAG: 16S rRNA processing protein RimM [Syntrophobacterales bacterium CG_4_8_14_3_um_filter_58_8]
MELIEIGRIVRSHGLTGRVKAVSYLESPETLHDVSGLFVGRSVQDAVFVPLVAVQTGKGFFILQLSGVDDRDAAERLRGSSVWISSEKIVKPPDGEYYWNQIIGLQVLTEEDEILGRIEAVFPTGSNDVYVCRGRGREILLPAIEEVVRKIDTERGVMVVRLLKGL